MTQYVNPMSKNKEHVLPKTQYTPHHDDNFACLKMKSFMCYTKDPNLIKTKVLAFLYKCWNFHRIIRRLNTKFDLSWHTIICHLITSLSRYKLGILHEVYLWSTDSIYIYNALRTLCQPHYLSEINFSLLIQSHLWYQLSSFWRRA